jgi:hypothetical protein
MRKLALAVLLLLGAGLVAVAAEEPADDNPVIARFEVTNIDFARMPAAPRHLNDMLALAHDGSVMVMLFRRTNFEVLTVSNLNSMPLSVVAQAATARSLADRLLILTDHRVQFTPQNPRELVSLRESRTTVAELAALLAAYGDVKVE